MTRVVLDKIASAAKNAPVSMNAYVTPDIVAREGYIVAVRVLNDKAVYNLLENVHGRMMHIRPGDRIAGVLGHRRALHGYAGYVPEKLAVGDRLNILNTGGVIGCCTSYAPDVGPPFEAELLGAVLHFPYLGERIGEPAHIGLNALETTASLSGSAPIVAVVGTCMNAGKTLAACQIIHGLSVKGKRVAGGKVTGVALQRDVLNMLDHGAVRAVSFIDAGVVSTDPGSAPGAAVRVIGKLNEDRPDAIVIEFGDGLLGDYGIQAILERPDVLGHIKAVVLCANDPVGAWGGVRLLADRYRLAAHVVTGRVTDNEVGCAYVEGDLGMPAANAISRPSKLVEHVERQVFGHDAA